jgi:hypothetical protein
MKNIFLWLAIILLAFGQSCKSGDKRNEIPGDKRSVIRFAPPVVKEDAEVIDDFTVNPVDRKLTKEATISFETNDYKTVCLDIRNLISKYNGQIIKESDSKRRNNDVEDNEDPENNKPEACNESEANFDVRIPAKSFDLFIRELKSVGGKIVNKEINIEDITAGYIDIQARLNTKKKLEVRYLQLLKKAKKVTEILEIEKQLNIQRTEIDSIEGRSKLLKHEIAYNSLHISVLEKKTAISDFFDRMLKAIVNGFSLLLQSILGVLTIWPFILIACIIGFSIRKYFSKKQPSEISEKIIPENIVPIQEHSEELPENIIPIQESPEELPLEIKKKKKRGSKKDRISKNKDVK